MVNGMLSERTPANGNGTATTPTMVAPRHIMEFRVAQRLPKIPEIQGTPGHRTGK